MPSNTPFLTLEDRKTGDRIAEAPEESDYTSVQDRIESTKVLKNASSTSLGQKRKLVKSLRDRLLTPVYLNERSKAGQMISKLESRASDKGFLPFKLGDYLDFADWTGRELVRGNKGGSFFDQW